jgi:hypothetical protein
LTAGNGATIADALQKGASGDSLWEAGWDDEDIEDDFAKKLRCVVASSCTSMCGVCLTPAVLKPGGAANGMGRLRETV